MKNFYITFLGCMVLANVFAQPITITVADVATPGNKAFMVKDTTLTNFLSQQAVKSGDSIVWNFNSLANHVADTVNFYDPSNTQFGSSFPDAALSAYSSYDKYYYYFSKSNAGLFIEGAVGDVANIGVNSVVKANPKQTVITFPATYQTSYNDTSKFTVREYYGQYVDIGLPQPVFVDSIKVQQLNYSQSVIDGWGKLKLPVGNFDVLRQLVTQVKTESQFAFVQSMGGWFPFDSFTDTVNRLYWWTNGIGYPIAECLYIPANNKVKNLKYVTNNLVTSISEEVTKTTGLNAYPNPAVDQINILGFPENASNIMIYDISGQLIKRENIENISKWVLVTSEMNNGTYFYHITDKNGTSLNSDLFSISH